MWYLRGLWTSKNIQSFAYMYIKYVKKWRKYETADGPWFGRT